VQEFRQAGREGRPPEEIQRLADAASEAQKALNKEMKRAGPAQTAQRQEHEMAQIEEQQHFPPQEETREAEDAATRHRLRQAAERLRTAGERLRWAYPEGVPRQAWKGERGAPEEQFFRAHRRPDEMLEDGEMMDRWARRAELAHRRG